jgi:hypothetical protein
MSFTFSVSPPDGTTYSTNPKISCSFASSTTPYLSLGTGETIAMGPTVTCSVQPESTKGYAPTPVTCSSVLSQTNSLTMTLENSESKNNYGSCTLTPK